jgi:hypothetical protein
MIDDKKSKGSHVTFCHIYSHIEDKLAKAAKKDRKELDEWQQKINSQKAEYGEWYDLYVAGNIEVDELTRTVPNMSIVSSTFSEGMDRFVLLDDQFTPVEDHIRKWISNILIEKDFKSWKKRCPARTAYYDFNDVINDRDKLLFNIKNVRSDRIANWWHKAKQKPLSSKSMLHKRGLSSSDNEWTKYYKEVYVDELCVWCKNKGLNVKDNITHAMAECHQGYEFDESLRTEIMSILKKYCNTTLADCNLWFHHDSHFDLNPFASFDRTKGSIGWIPKDIKKIIKKWGCVSKSARESCVNELFITVLKNRYNKYIDRWSRLDIILNINVNLKATKHAIKNKRNNLDNISNFE